MVGEVKYKNLDDDPVIDNRDRQIIGNTNPDYQYGITNTLEWKNWTFSFFLQGTQGNDVLNVNLKKFDIPAWIICLILFITIVGLPKIGQMPNGSVPIEPVHVL